MLLGEILLAKGLVDGDQLSAALKEQSAQPDKKLGEILVACGLVSLQDMLQVLEIQLLYNYTGTAAQHHQVRLGDLMVDWGIISPDQLEKALVIQKKDPARRLGEIIIDQGFAGIGECLAFLEIQAKAAQHSSGNSL